MKKLLLLMSLWVGVVSAQSLQTYSVYDTNQNGEITVSDVTEIVDKVKSNISAANTQQYVTAEDLSLALQSIQNDLKLIKEKLGIDDTPTPPAQLASFEISSKNLKVGETFTQTVTTSVDGTITYYSNNTSVATVNASTGLVKAVSQGNAIISAIIESASNQDVLSASYIINVEKANQMNGHEYVDLGLPSGTLWATCNVGANSPEEYGAYFAWGETEPKSTYNWNTYFDSVNGSSSDFRKYYIGGKTELDLEDDAAYMNWGEGWRMPSVAQLNELHTYCTWTWDSTKKGYTFVGPNKSFLFLPAAGYYYDSSLHSAGSISDYWSRSLNIYSDDACFLSLMSGSGYRGDYRRLYGRSVRPVCQN